MRHVGFDKLDNFFRRMLLSMTLMLFSIHAVLPAGFMPDFITLRDGEINIVVCTVHGYQTVIVDQEGNPVNPSDHDESAKAPQCEFNTPGSKVFVQQAPILNEMSIAGFRGSFRLRKGELGARDGNWLLRVERETHDIVLDRFPWSVQVVKLPWMESRMQVEW